MKRSPGVIFGVLCITGIVLGWIYWWRGLELAIVTHMVAIATVYIVVPVFL